MTTPFEHHNSLRIFGPAGAGKTRELVRILREHVDDGDFHLVEGIIVSFTRAAAHDLAWRVNPDGAPGRYHCTLHALCKRYYGFESELAEKHMKEFFAEQGIRYRPGRSPDPEDWSGSPDEPRSEGALLLAFWNLCRNRLMTLPEGREFYAPEPELTHWWDESMDRLFVRYQQWKDAHGYVDFTDMLEYAVTSPPRSSWAFFVLDEAQDCTPLQWQVVMAFAGCCDVVYIAGDDDQAIYAFAGATPQEFLHAGVSQTDVLHVNHRSGSKLVYEAQKFIRRNADRRDKDMQSTREGGDITRVSGYLPELDIGESTFVMARARYLTAPICAELEKQGFPFLDRSNSAGVNGKAASAYQRMLRLSRNHAVSLDEWRIFLEAVPSAGPWIEHGAKARLKKIDTEFLHDTMVRLADLTQYGATETMVNALRSREIAVLGRIDQSRLGYLREVETRHGEGYLQPETAAKVCQVGSIHAFKGLECDHAVIHSGIPPRAMREAYRDPEPERRVYYVALTRAKHHITHFNPPAFTYQWESIL